MSSGAWSLLLYDRGAVGGDVTAPGNINVTNITASKVSRVVGKDLTDITFSADEAFVEYMIRKVALATDPFTSGTLIEQAVIGGSGPTLLFQNTFDGGSDGNPVTVANSGGASGDPWSAVSSTNTLNYSSAHSHSGGMAVADDQTALTVRYVEWQPATMPGAVVWRNYMWFPSGAIGGTYQPWRMYAGSTHIGGLGIGTTGLMRLLQGSTLITLGTVPITRDAWVRIEVKWDITNNTVSSRLFNNAHVEDTVPDEEITGPLTLAGATKIRFGSATTAAGPTGMVIYHDSAGAHTDWVGPLSVGSAVTQYTTTLTDDELVAAGAVEGSNLVKVFVKDAAGNWSS